MPPKIDASRKIVIEDVYPDSTVLAGIAATASFHQLAALVSMLALSPVGTAAIGFAPELGRFMFPRREVRPLAARGFNPELAGFDPPAEK